MRCIACFAAGVLAVVIPAAGAEPLASPTGSLVRLTTTPRLDEARPVAGNGYLAWAQNSVQHPNRYSTYTRRGNGRAVRVNPSGTQAWPGAISGHTLVYEQRGKPVPGRSNVKLYDLRRNRRYDPPGGVNTRAWEGYPSLSGSWLLFLRVDGETARWLASHLRTGETLELRRDVGRCTFPTDPAVGRSQVNGRWAVYQGCSAPGRYDLRLRQRASLEFGGIASLVWRSPSVARDGTVHYVSFSTHSGTGPVHLSRRPARLDPRIPYEDLLLLPAGEMIRSSYVSADAVYFDRQPRADAPADLYRLDP